MVVVGELVMCVSVSACTRACVRVFRVSRVCVLCVCVVCCMYVSCMRVCFVCMCICVCICVCMYTCMCMRVYVYVMYVFVHVRSVTSACSRHMTAILFVTPRAACARVQSASIKSDSSLLCMCWRHLSHFLQVYAPPVELSALHVV